MTKGIIALFTSGIIFRLPVLGGILIGFYMMSAFSEKEIFSAFHNPLLYAIGVIICSIYAFVFKKVYKKGGSIVDWRATFYSLFGHFVSYVFALIFSCLFIYTISLGGFDNEDEAQSLSDAEINAQVNELINNIKKSGY